MTNKNNKGSKADPCLARNTKMFWIAAGCTLFLTGLFTAAFFREEIGVRDVPVEIVIILSGFIATYAIHNKNTKSKDDEEKSRFGEWILISTLVWAAIIFGLYQGNAYERLWGIEGVAVPQHFYRFLEIITFIFGVSGIWDFIPGLKSKKI